MSSGLRRVTLPALFLDLLAAAAITYLTDVLLQVSGGVWEHVGGRDLHGIFLSKYDYALQAIRGLHLPLWNRAEFCGTPLLANAQAALLYPPVVWWFSILSPQAALRFLNGTHVLLLTWAIIIYLRRHGIPRFGGALAALIALAGVCSAPAGAVFDHPNYIATIAWCPVVLILWEKSLRAGGRWVIACGFASAMQWLAGYPEFAMDTAIFLGIAAALSGEAPIARRFTYAAAGLLIGVGLAAVQLLPLAEAVGESVRPEAREHYAFIRTLAQTNSFDAIHEELRRYGLAAGVLAVVAVVFDRSRSRVTWLACFVWALFALTFPLSLLYSVFPFSGVRLPLGWRYLAPIFAGALAAAGFHRLWTARVFAFRGQATATKGVALLLAAAAMWYSAKCILEYPESLGRRPPNYALMNRRAATIGALRNKLDPSARVVAYPETFAGFALHYDLPSPHGYEPALPPRRMAHLLAALSLDRRRTFDTKAASAIATRPHIAGLVGLGFVAVPRTVAPVLRSAGFARVRDIPPSDVVLYRRPVPRVSLAHQAAVVGNEQESLKKVLARQAGAEDHVVVNIPAGAAMPRLEEPERESGEAARIIADEAERVVVTANVSTAALLVLRDAFYPGWRALVDGTEVPILEVDHAFRGVPLNPGNHVIEFEYAPTSLKVGAIASGMTLLVVLIWLRRLQKGSPTT